MTKIPEEIIAKIKEIYTKNKTTTLTELAKRFSISREGIKKRLIKEGISIRPNREIAKIKRNQKVDYLCKVYDKVKSLRKVRKITGYSINFIKRCIKGKVQFPIYPRPLKSGFEKITLKKVRIYAHTIFDGCISHSKYNSYIVCYVNKSPELLKEFEKDVGLVYGLKPTKSKIESGVTNIIYSSKLMYLDILNFDKSVIKRNKEYKKIYIRAFFDDEGNVNFRPKSGGFVISGSQHNQEEILFIKSLLDDLGLQNNTYKFLIEITLNKTNLKYNKLIGFTHPEKREKILEGINYYKKKFEKINNQNIKIKELTKKGLNHNQISKIINMHPDTIKFRIKSGFKANKYDYRNI